MPAQLSKLKIPARLLAMTAQALHVQESELTQLLNGTQIDASLLYQGSEQFISGEQFLLFSKNLMTLRPSNLTGLSIGEQLSLAAMWPLDELFLNAPDLFSALSAPPEFHPLRLPFLRTRLQQGADFLSVELIFFIDLEPNLRRFLTEAFALTIQSLAQAYIGEQIPECQFQFSYNKPSYYREYRHYFAAETLFKQTSDCYLIPIKYAAYSSPKANSSAYLLAQDICRQQVKQVTNDTLSLSDRICRILLSQPLGKLNEESVAKALFVSKRTLARRLDVENTSYRKIRDELLAELAARQLRDSHNSVESIASALGYSDTPNFRRAFKRWYQLSPKEYRQRL